MSLVPFLGILGTGMFWKKFLADTPVEDVVASEYADEADVEESSGSLYGLWSIPSTVILDVLDGAQNEVEQSIM